jgi:cell wall-associated NlpC family hydrolase
MLLKDIYKQALQKTFGKPYIWGAKGPFAYDCSGLVQSILKPSQILPITEMNADEIYRFMLPIGGLNVRGMGSLAFYGSTFHIHHVGFCLDELVMLNAAGGGPNITSIQLAISSNASVKIEPIDLRGDLVAVIMPPYAQHGITN